MSSKIFSKEQLRKNIYCSREKINKKLKQEMDFNIFDTLISSEEYKRCDTLFIYVSKQIEVDTYNIIEHSFKEGKLVAVPKCNAENLIMRFYKVTSFDDLKKGYFQIYEPIEERCKEVIDFSCGVCVVPGLCFDIYGYRLGYGKGYYDRFLKNFGGTKIGICYSDYIFENITVDKHDEKVDILVTEKNILEVVV